MRGCASLAPRAHLVDGRTDLHDRSRIRPRVSSSPAVALRVPNRRSTPSAGPHPQPHHGKTGTVDTERCCLAPGPIGTRRYVRALSADRRWRYELLSTGHDGGPVTSSGSVGRYSSPATGHRPPATGGGSRCRYWLKMVRLVSLPRSAERCPATSCGTWAGDVPLCGARVLMAFSRSAHDRFRVVVEPGGMSTGAAWAS